MLGKFGILIAILVLVLLFFLVISLGAGAFSKSNVKPETKKYLKSVNILLIIIFGIATVLFSLIFTAYIYSIPPGQDTMYLLKPNLLWLNTTVLFFVSYFFYKIVNDLEKKETSKIKKNLIIVGGLSYLFLFGQIIFWMQLMKSGNYVTTNTYFSSFYVFTTLHGLHLLGGLFFWGKVASRVLKLENNKILDEEKSISALSWYWTFLLIVWLAFFLMIYIFNDAFIDWCKSLIS